MKIADVAGAVFVFPEGPGRLSPERALAGPFVDGTEARWWILAQAEGRLTPEQWAQYEPLKTAAGGTTADVGQLLGLVKLVTLKTPVPPEMAGPIRPDPGRISRRLTDVVKHEREPGEE